MLCPNCKSNNIEYWENFIVVRKGIVGKNGKRIGKLINTGNTSYNGSGYTCLNCGAEYKYLSDLEKE